jgi:putative membrane protein
MDRRHLLTGIAGFAVAAPALAQQAQPANPQMTQPQTDAARGGTYQGAAGSQQMSQAEQRWMQQTMMAGAAALQTSEIALQKATDDWVKQFAQFEADEQRTIAEVLRSMMEPAGTASAQAAASPPQLDQKHAQMVQKLQQAKAGEDFDKMYIDGQLQGHQELFDIQETFLKGGANAGRRESMNAAKLARGHIKEHLQVLKDIKDEL